MKAVASIMPNNAEEMAPNNLEIHSSIPITRTVKLKGGELTKRLDING